MKSEQQIKEELNKVLAEEILQERHAEAERLCEREQRKKKIETLRWVLE